MTEQDITKKEHETPFYVLKTALVDQHGKEKEISSSVQRLVPAADFQEVVADLRWALRFVLGDYQNTGNSVVYFYAKKKWDRWCE